jgi:hypothetical protein
LAVLLASLGPLWRISMQAMIDVNRANRGLRRITAIGHQGV